MKHAIFLSGEYEYQYEIIDGVHTLFYADSAPWSLGTRGTVALRVKDNGDEHVFFTGDSKKSGLPKKIDYGLGSQLHIMLSILYPDRNLEIAEKKKL